MTKTKKKYEISLNGQTATSVEEENLSTLLLRLSRLDLNKAGKVMQIAIIEVVNVDT